jgi:hypothetical protein
MRYSSAVKIVKYYTLCAFSSQLGVSSEAGGESPSEVAFDVPGERIVHRKQPPGTSAAT